MKTRRILAASTAALLSFASVAVVANASGNSAVTIDNDDKEDYVAAGDIKYRVDKASDFEDLTIVGNDVTSTVISSNAVAAGEALEKLSSTMKNSIAKASTAGEVKVIDITVAYDYSNGYQEVVDVALKKPVYISVEALGFEGAHVYHLEGDGKKLVEIPCKKTTDGTDKGVLFSTKSFSPFVITKDAIKGATALDDDENPANDDDETSSGASNTSGATGANNAETGIALAIAPVVLAAGAVAVVALKKKH